MPLASRRAGRGGGRGARVHGRVSSGQRPGPAPPPARPRSRHRSRESAGLGAGVRAAGSERGAGGAGRPLATSPRAGQWGGRGDSRPGGRPAGFLNGDRGPRSGSRRGGAGRRPRLRSGCGTRPRSPRSGRGAPWRAEAQPADKADPAPGTGGELQKRGAVPRTEPSPLCPQGPAPLGWGGHDADRVRPPRGQGSSRASSVSPARVSHRGTRAAAGGRAGATGGRAELGVA